MSSSQKSRLNSNQAAKVPYPLVCRKVHIAAITLVKPTSSVLAFHIRNFQR